MKVITNLETRQVEIRTFIAEDGTKFDDSITCEKYEKDLVKSDLRKQVKQIEKKEGVFGYAPLDGGEYYESHEFIWYYPKNIEEINVINEYYESNNLLAEDSINSWVCIEMYDPDYPQGDVWVMYLEDSINHIKDFLDVFGYECKINIKS